MAFEEEKSGLMAVFPDIVRELMDAEDLADIPEVTKRHREMLQYNVLNRNLFSGVALVKAYRTLEDPDKLTPENLRLSYIMGWCVEFYISFLLMLDDIVDHSETRRGKPCWYKNPGIGLSAINDALLVEADVYTILRRHFSSLHCYKPAIELFHETTKKSMLGQLLDLMPNANGKPDLSLFTMERYSTLVKYKTGCNFQLPITLAMYLAGKYDPEVHRLAETSLLGMGDLYQIRDDFLDCFGDSNRTGKIGSDIREGKCTWLVVTALEKATPKQKELLEASYGSSDPEAVRAVRNLYEELGLPNFYLTYMEEKKALVRTYIQQMCEVVPNDVFFQLMDRIDEWIA